MRFGSRQHTSAVKYSWKAVASFLFNASLAVQGMLGGSIDFGCQREMINLAAQRLKPPPQLAPECVFDFSFARKAAEG